MSEALALPQDTAVSEVAQLPPLTEEQSHFLIEHVWRFFCSLRLVVANFVGLFFGMILGTFANPSNDTLANIEQAYAARPYGTVWIWLNRTFELYDLFHSWWFTLLLLSLGLNLIACSLERLPRIYYLVRYPQLRLEEIKGLRLPIVQGASSTLSVEQVQAILKKRGYRTLVTPRDNTGGADIFAERGRYARFGVWVIHIFLLLVLGGGIVGRLTAFEGTTDVPQNGGETDSFVIRRPDGSAFRRALGFKVKCDDFRLKEFSPGRPKAFESDLRVLSLERGHEGEVLASKTITVNDPLKFGGMTFYQASYRQLDKGLRARLELIDKATAKEQTFLASSADDIDAAEGLSYQLVDYSEDFAGLGPAVQVIRAEQPPGATVRQMGGPRRASPAGTKMTSFWVFKNRPEFDRDNREDRFALRFDRLAAFYATGLQVARDPSIPVVYTGCFGIFLGIGIAFYTSHKRLWVRAANGKLALGGAAHRNQEGFADEFGALCEELGLAAPKRKEAVA